MRAQTFRRNRNLSSLLICLALVPFGCTSTLRETVRARPPNIVFILADDLGYGDLGCYGQQRIKTPSLDKMAAEGIRFTQAYAGATVCAPSRCVLMTGKHIGHARVRGNAGKNNPLAQSLRSTDVTVARLLKEAGYSTALIGKWGLGDVGPAQEGLPRRHGFDYFFGYLNQQHAHNYFPTFLWRNETRVELNNVVPAEEPSGAGVATERREYAHDLLAAEAFKFIRDTKDRPFFLFFAPTIPHANNEAKNKGMEVPDLGPYAELTWPEPQKAHAAMVTRLDRDVGRILDLLEELQIEDQTLVLFSSDNGPHREGGYDPGFNKSSGPLRGIKRDHYEGGIRVPMIARWPGRIPQGVVSDTIWGFVDMLPTFAELGHALVPAGVDGMSVMPALLGKKQRDLNERFLYWEFHEGGFKQAARWKDWKAVRNGARQPLELYHLSTDLREQQNVAGRHPSIVRRFETFFKTARTDSPDWPVKPAPAGESKS